MWWNKKHIDYGEPLKSIINVIANKSKYYRGHSTRVGLIAKAICDSLEITNQLRTDIIEGAYLHDIGKIRIDLSILDKADKLTDAEMHSVKDHCVVGYDILKDFGFNPDVLACVLYHHENVDGTGYPLSIAGTNIPIGARIIRIADSIDAMGSDRAYREAMPFCEIAEELEANSGKQFDSAIVAKCLNGLNPRIKLILAQQRV